MNNYLRSLLRWLPPAGVLLFGLTVGMPCAQAATFFWDADGATAGFTSNATGTWGTSTFWSTDITGSTAGANTPITSVDDVNFGSASSGFSTASTVAISGAQSVNSITFGAGNTAGVTFLGGTSLILGSSSTITNNSASTLKFDTALAGSNGFTKTGTGSLTLSGNNTYTGGTTINGGFISVNSSTALGSGTVTINSGTTNSLALGQVAGVNLANAITLNSTGVASNGLIQNRLGPFAATVSGDINIIKAAAVGGHFFGSGTGVELTLSGKITATPGITVTQRGGDVIYSGSGSSFDRLQTISNTGNTVKLGANDGLATNAIIDLPNTGANQTLDLAGFSQSLRGITTSTYIPGSTNSIVTNSGGSTSTLTLTSGTSTFNGVVQNGASAVALTVAGATQTLTGANTYTGGTTVTAGTVTLGHATNTLADTGAVTVSGGTLALGSNSDTVGAVTVSGGTISGSTGVLTGSSYNLQSGTVSANLGGTGSAATKTTSGTLTLSGANTYTGGTAINAGTLNFTTGGLGTTGAVSFTGDATLQYGSSTTTDLSLRLAIGNGFTGTVDTNGNNVTFAGGFGASGSGALTKAGAGTLTLSGANTFTGLTTVSAGMLAIGSAGSLASGNALTLDASGTADFANAGQTLGAVSNANTTSNALNFSATTGTMTLASLSGAGNTTFGSLASIGTLSAGTVNLNGATSTITALNGGTVNLGSGTVLTVSDGTTSGAITGTGGSLTKTSSGTLTLNGTNTYTGGTNLSAGTLNFTTGGLGTTGTVTFTGNSTLQYGTTTTTDLSSRLAIGNGITGTVNTNGNNVTFATGLGASGSGALTKAGTGTLSLNGVNTYTGLTTVTGGALAIGSSGSLFSGNALTLGASGTADFANAGQTLGAVSNANTATNALNFSAATGTVTLTSLSGAGNTTFGSLATIGTLSDGTANLNGATSAIATLSGGTVNLGSGTALTVSDGTSAGAITGTGGSLTKTSAGTLTLTGANSFTGTTTVSAGVLNIRHDTALGTTGPGAGTSVASGAALQLQGGITVGDEALTLDGSGVGASGGALRNISGANTYGGLITLGGTSRINSDAGTLTLSHAGTITGAGFDLTLGGAGDIVVESILGTGSGNLIKDGTGTVTLSGANTFTGTTTINAGTLKLGDANALDSSSAILLANAAGVILDLNGFNVTLGSISGGGNLGGSVSLGATTLTVGGDNSSTTYANTISGGGGLTKTGTGTLTLSGTNNYAGATRVSGGTLQAGGTSAFGNASAVTLDNTTGVTLDLDNNNTTLGSLAGGGAAGGNVSLGTGTLTTGSLGTATSYAGVISGGGGLTQTGTGTLTLTRAQSYTGATTIDSGATLQLGNGTTDGSVLTSSGITNNGVVIFNLAGSQTNALAIDGTGSLTKSGAGTLALTGANSYTGGTNLAGGTLAFTTGGLGTSGAVTFTGNSTLQYGTATTTDLSSRLALSNGVIGTIDTNGNNVSFASDFGASSSGGFTKSGVGTLTLTAAQSYTGATVIGSGGTLQIGNGTTDGSVAASSGITNNGALIFNLAGSQTNALAIGGTGTLTKTGAGTLTLTGVNGFTGATTVAAGTLAFNAAAALSATSGINLADTTTLTYTGGTTTVNRDLAVTGGTGTLRNTGSGTLTLSGTLTKNGTTLRFAQGLFDVTGTIAGASANSDLVVDAATVTLSGANSYSGPTFLRNGATLTAAVAGALPTATRSALVMDDTGGSGSTFQLGADQVAASLTGETTSTVALGSHALTIGTTGGSTTFAGTLSGTGGRLIKDGTSTLILAGTATHTGTTTVNAGTLQAGSVNALSAASALTLANTAGAGLALNNFSQTIGSLAGGGSTGGNVALGSATLTTGGNATSTSYAGVISGATGNLTKTGAGSFALTGTNTYTGTTTVNAGTLTLHAASGVALAGTTAVDIGSGGTVSLGAANQINTASTLTLGGGTLALGGFSQTLGTLSLTANSTLDLGTTAALAFADSHSLNWGTSTLSVSNFTSGTTLLSFGSNATGLTAGQLGLFRFVEFGNSAARIDASGFLAPLSSDIANVGSTEFVISTPISGTTAVNQSGSGSITLTGVNTSSGTATVSAGTLVIGTAVGGNWAGNVTVSGSGILKGRGDITGLVTINAAGTYSPGNSPAIQNVGSLTVNTGGFVEIELDGATAGNGAGFHDQIASTGAVTLTGGTLIGQTIFSGSGGYLPTIGAVHAVITGSTVTGKFDGYTFNAAANAAGITWLPEYTTTAVNLYAVPSDYATAVAGLSANQTQVGVALQSLRNSGLRFELDQRTALDSRATLFNGLKTKDAAGLRTAYDQLNPEKLTALAASTFQSASILNSSLQQRSAELRRFGPASVSLNGVATPAAAEDYRVETVIEDGVHYQIAKAKPQKRYGYFASATGAFASVDGSVDRLGSFSQTGAATAGVDYALNENQSVGLVISQALAEIDFSSNSGSSRTTTSRVGVFHDYHNGGFFVNTSVSAGFSTYESQRKIAFLNQTAQGETQGLSYGGQLSTGYDFKLGGFILGPTVSVAYDHAYIASFDETGSAAGLKLRRQNADSLVTQLGLHVSRPFFWKRIGWIPDVRLGVSRQAFNPNPITARFAAGGDAFRVTPQNAGSEYVNPGASLSALLPNGWTMRLSYDAILNPQSAEHRVNLSLNAGF